MGASFFMAMAALLLFLLSGSLAVILWLSPVMVKRKLDKSGFSGPPPSFPLGNIPEMKRKTDGATAAAASICSPGITHDIHCAVFPYFTRWRKTYGKVFVYWLGTEPFLYVADPEFLKGVTSGALDKSWGKPEVFKRDRWPMFGNGLVMANGDDWVHHRHIIAPAFSATNLNDMMGLMVKSTTNMIEDWNKRVAMGDHELDVEKHITKNAAEIIAEASFGISQTEGKKVFEKLQAMQALLFKSSRLIGVPFSKLLNPKHSHEAWKLGKEIDQLLLSIITSAMEQQPCGDQKNNLLGLMLAAGRQSNVEPEKKLTARELVDECKTFFFGGHETTALALTWTLVLLALHPEWQQVLREEIMEVCGEGPLESNMLTKLTKMGWVLNEVVRLYSPSPNTQRQAREDVHAGDGVVIPKGTNMWIDVVGMHHDRALWGDDVNEFKPERFKESVHGGCKHRMAYIPFGFGGRLCVGRNLTMMEYKIVLSLILRKFYVSMSPAYCHSPRVMLSLRPSHGVPLILEPIN